MNRSVFLSLIALDSYNRGLGANLEVAGTKLGAATLKPVGISAADLAAGFYASAYDWDGKTVISYRGTNFTSVEAALPDILNGWSMFTGFGSSSQASAARTFFRAATGADFVEGTTLIPDAIVTGHSLGGALAGYVAARSGVDAFVVDPIPYGALTWQSTISDAFGATVADLKLGGGNIGQFILDAVAGGVIGASSVTWGQFAERFAANIRVRSPELDRVVGASLQGEIASLIPSLQGPLSLALVGAGTILQNGIFAALGSFLSSAGSASLGQFALEQIAGDRSLIKSIPNYGASQSPVELHSASLITTILFGREQWKSEGGRGDWEQAANYFLPQLNSNDIASRLSGQFGGQSSNGDKMAAAIAYSVIDEGDPNARPFGDTAIRALFNDADDLGRTLNTFGSALPKVFDENVLNAVAAMSIQFAGQLAYNGKLSAADNKVLAGVLGFGTGDNNVIQSFTIDLREATWAAAGQGNAPMQGKDSLVDAFLLADPNGYAGLGKIVDWYGKETSGALVSDIDFVSLSLRPGSLFEAKTDGKVQLIIGTDTVDSFTLTSGNDFVMGLDGYDVLLGGKGSDILLGGAGEDTLDGGDEADWLEGGAAVDILYGGKGSDTIRGGSGNDQLYNGAQDGSDDGEADTLIGGAGVDVFHVGAGDRIAADGNRAIEAGEKIYFRGKLLVGGERTSASNDPNGTYFNQDGTTYGLSGKNLSVTSGGATLRGMAGARAVGGSFEIEDFRNGDAGIRLRTKRPDDREAARRRDPLILDLDLDKRVVTALAASSAYFDLDNDGFRERVAWANAGDGFLVIDRNANGEIDEGSEMFGTGAREVVAGEGQNSGRDGFAELGLLDTNHDRIIDAKDAEFDRLQVWVDANGDGLTDAGELKTLAELGLTSISLKTYAPQNIELPADHSLITAASRATRADGTTIGVYDAYLAIDNYDTVERNPVEVSTELRSLPFLIGRGSLSDLDVAMARDPALAEMVGAFATLTVENAGDVSALVERILLRWTGADAVASDSRGPDADARIVRALEAISGNDFNQVGIGRNPRADAAEILSRDWQRIVGETTVQLLGQTALGGLILPGIRFEAAAFLVAADGTTLDTVIAAATAAMPSDAGARIGYWRGIVAAVNASAAALGVSEQDSFSALDAALSSAGIGFSAKALASAVYVGGASGTSSALIGSNIRDLVIGDAAKVELNGNQGDDEYVLTGEVRQATIVDRSGYDRLVLDAWSRTETAVGAVVTERDLNDDGVVTRLAIDVTLTNAGRTVGFSLVAGLSGVQMEIDEVAFADGQTLSVVDLLAEVSAQIGVVIGENGPSFDVQGSSADEVVIGRGPSDRYHLAPGGGHDVVIDSRSGVSTGDELVIDAAPDAVEFAVSGGARQELVVRLRDGSASVTIASQWLNETAGVERFVFADGTSLSAAALRQRLTTGTSADERIDGTYLDDVIDGGGGTDVLRGGGGADRYVVRQGYGAQTIVDAIGGSTVQFAGDIAFADLDLAMDGKALVIRVRGTDTSVRVDAGADTTTIAAAGETAAAGALLIQQARRAGSKVDGNVYGTAGDDTIEGTAQAERIELGGGTDYVRGGGGNDTYVFTGGNKSIRDEGFGFDTLLIGGDARLEDLILTRAGSYGGIRVRIAGVAGRVDLGNGFDYRTGQADSYSDDDVERILFSDGRSVDLTSGRVMTGTAGSDVLFSFAGAQGVFTPGAGDDLIFSRQGSNTVRVFEGYGHDVLRSEYPAILEFSGIAYDDAVSFQRNDLDLVIRTGADSLTLKDAFAPLGGDPIYRISFADAYFGMEEVYARLSVPTAGDDLLFGQQRLDGGAGNDVLIGDGGTNDFVFGRGYGHDVIKLQDDTTGSGSRYDTLTLNGLDRSDVRFERSAEDPLSIVMTIIDTGETLTFDGTPFDGYERIYEDSLGDGYDTGDRGGAHWIERILFADGSEISQRSIEQAILDAGATDGNDVLLNFGAPLYSYDREPGSVLDGGAGDDRYVNPFLDVSVRLRLGGGRDVVDGRDHGRAGNVHVQLQGVRPEDVLVRFEERNERSYTVLYLLDGTELAIEEPKNGVDRHSVSITADGAAYAEFYVNDEGGLAANLVGSEERDFLTGERTPSGGGEGQYYGPTGIDETFVGGKGDDVIAGRGGIDTIEFARGDGADELLAVPQDNGGIDVPQLRTAIQTADFPNLPGSGPAGGYLLAFAEGIALEDLGFEWLPDGSGRVRITVGEEGDSITARAIDLVGATFADGSGVSFRGGPIGSTEVAPYSWLTNSESDETFYLPVGQVEIMFGSGAGSDRIIDGYLSDFDSSTTPPPGWASSTVRLEGPLTDYDFIRDADAPGNLVMVHRASGATMVVEGQFAAEQAIPDAPAWQSVPRDAEDRLDWSAFDVARVTAGTLRLDLDGDGTPDWTAPGGGSDAVGWRRQPFQAIDSNGDGYWDHTRSDGDGDGVLDTFTVKSKFGGGPGSPSIAFRDLDGDGIPDEASSDWQLWTAVPRSADGTADWASLDVDGNGTPDGAPLDTDGDGTPDWLNPDSNGDGVSDWVDLSTDLFVDAAGNTIAARTTGGDGTRRWAFQDAGTGLGMLVLRDTDGDGQPDEFGWDRNGDGEGDQIITPRTVLQFVATEATQDGEVTTYHDWSEVNALVRSASMGSGRDPTRQVLLIPPQAGAGDDVIVVDGYSPFQIDGLGGNDRIVSREVPVTLVFGPGSGNDLFLGKAEQYNGSTVRLNGIRSVEEIQFLRGEGEDLVVRITATGETLTIRDQLARGTGGATPVVHRFTFDDGSELSWQDSLGYIVGMSSDGAGEVASGGAGGVLDGGGGSDVLRGGTGDDTYRFGRGYAEDLIRDAGGNDTIVFGEGIAPDDIFFSRGGANGEDLLIEVTGEERLAATVAGQFANGTSRMETFLFADGTALTWRDVQRRILALAATGGDDTVAGFGTDDRIVGRAGNDVLTGRGGDDAIDGGEGRDTAVFSGRRDEYEVVTENGVITVRDLVAARDGLDRLVSVEDLRFVGDATDAPVKPANRAPTSPTTRFSVREDGDLAIAPAVLIASASDADGDVIGLAGVAAARNGRAWIDLDGNVRFRPDADFAGEAGFQYVLTDANGGRTLVDAMVTVEALNDAPRAVGVVSAITIDEDGAVDVTLPTDLFRDVDDAVLNVSVGLAGGGALPVWLTYADGRLTGRPPADSNGAIALEVRGSDGLATAAIAFSLNIRPVEDAPRVVASIGERKVTRGEVFDVVLASAISDPDGDALAFAATQADGSPLPAWLRVEAGRLVGTVPAGFEGPLSIAVSGSDGRGRATDYFVISGEVRHAPTLARALVDVSVEEDAAIAVTIPVGTFTDADGDALTLSARLANGDPLPMWLGFDGLRLTGTPPKDYNGALDLEVSASDGTAVATGRFRLTVAPRNDVPVLVTSIADARFDEDGVVLIDLPANMFADADEDALKLTASLAGGDPLPEWLVFDGVRFTGKPPAHYHGDLTIEVTANDGVISANDQFVLSITPVNDAPEVAAPMADRTFREDQPIDFAVPTGTFTDVDGDPLAVSARLADGRPLPDWLAFDGSRFTGTPPADFNGAIAIDVTASDGTLDTTTRFTLAIDPVNDAPVLAQALPDALGREDAAFAFDLPTGAFSDADGDALVLTATLVDGNGLPDWIAFDGARFTGTPPGDYNGVVDILVTASDGILNARDVFRLTIEAVNDAPVRVVALADVSAYEDGTISVALPAGAFTDVDGTLMLSARLATGDALPDWLKFDGTRLTGTPPADFNGRLGIEVIASDGQTSASDVFDLTIIPVNDAPVARLTLADRRITEDSAIAIALPTDLFGDSDGDALTLSASLADGGALPSWLRFDGTEFKGTPPADYNGTLTLRIVASDGALTANVDLRLVVDPVNDAPLLVRPLGDQRTSEDRTFAIKLPQGQFADSDGDTLAITVRLADGSALPAWIVFDGISLTGAPPPDFNGTLDLELVASDGVLKAIDRFRLVVDPVPDAPVVLRPIADLAIREDQLLDFTLPGGTFGDADGDALTITATLVDGRPLPSWLRFDGARLTGTPPADYNGSLDLAFTASDGTLSVTDQVRLGIQPVNDAPTLQTAIPDASVAEDTAFVIVLPSGSFSDLDGDVLGYTARKSDGGPLPTWLRFDGARFTGTPPANFNGAVDVEVTASDGALTATDVFRLTVTAVNDAPVVALALADRSVPDNRSVDFSVPVGTFIDVDSSSLTLSATLANGAALPSWLRFADGRFTGTPPVGAAALTIRVTANDGQATAFDDFVLSVTATNRTPVVSQPLIDRSVAEDAAIDFTVPAGSFTDPDGNALTFTANLSNGDPLPGWLAFTSGRFTGMPPANFNGALDLTVVASDGSSSTSDTFRLTVTPVNDAPTVVAPLADRTARAGTAVDWTIPGGSFADIDNDALTLTATLANGAALPSWLTFQNGRFTGTPPQGAGNLAIRVTASDGRLSVTDEFAVTVNTANRAPTASNDGTYLVKSGDPLTILASSLVANDSDPDGDALTITEVSGASNGSVRLEGGDVVYSPTVGYKGSDRIRYTVSDGRGGTAQAYVNVAVTDPYAGWIQGGSGADLLFGNVTRGNSIAGNAGNDLLTGGFQTDRLAGGDGNDLLNGLAGDDQLWGQGGDDLLLGGTGHDTAFYAGLRSTYALKTGSGNLYVTVADGSNTNGNEGQDTLIGVETLSFRNGETVSIASPIVLDLDGDGVELVSAQEARATFDMDGDGIADDTSWVGGDDGFLFIDRDRNGTVSGAAELSFVDDAVNARSDLEGLRSFDSNGDGRIAVGDSRFDDFRIWRDANGDGRVDAGEVGTLGSFGIASVALAGKAVQGATAIGGAATLNTGGYTKLDGTISGFADVALSYFSGGDRTAVGLDFGAETFDGKRSKYRVSYSDGTMQVGRRKGPATAIDASTTLQFRNASVGMVTGIVLDLDGNGTATRSIKKSGVRFDMDGNGAADRTGWISKGDGLLVIDRNGDGRIAGPAELSLRTEAPDAGTDMEALAAFDMNDDGVLDVKDARFGELAVWRDGNGNGVTDAGELSSLTSIGINAIGLSSKATSGSAQIGDNVTLSNGGFRRSDGTTGGLADIAFAFTPTPTPPLKRAASASLDNGLSMLRDAMQDVDPFGRLDQDSTTREVAVGVPVAMVGIAPTTEMEVAMNTNFYAKLGAGEVQELLRFSHDISSFSGASSALYERPKDERAVFGAML